MAQYGAGVVMGMTLALALGRLLAEFLPRLMVTSTGLLMPAKYPWPLLLAAFAGVLLNILYQKEDCPAAADVRCIARVCLHI